MKAIPSTHVRVAGGAVSGLFAATTGPLVRTMIGLPVVVSVFAAWLVVHLRGRSTMRHIDELATEGAYLDDSLVESEAFGASNLELDEATAELLG
jgi:hypothetical protein